MGVFDCKSGSSGPFLREPDPLQPIAHAPTAASSHAHLVPRRMTCLLHGWGSSKGARVNRLMHLCHRAGGGRNFIGLGQRGGGEGASPLDWSKRRVYTPCSLPPSASL